MEISKLQDMLQTKTKKEIIEIIIESIENNKNIKDFIIENYFVENTMSEFEKIIIDKLTNSSSLQLEESNYCMERLKCKKNTKISSVLKGSNKFDSLLIKYKLEKYFEKIWKMYPRKVGKDLGKKSFIKLISQKKVSELDVGCKYFINKLNLYIQYCQDNNTEEQYILHLSTFCNSKKYL